MFDNNHRAFIAINDEKEVCLVPRMANRHGLITALPYGKTVTLQTLSETFSDMGVPVFAADMKGDLSGWQDRGQQRERQQTGGTVQPPREGVRVQALPGRFWTCLESRDTRYDHRHLHGTSAAGTAT